MKSEREEKGGSSIRRQTVRGMMWDGGRLRDSERKRHIIPFLKVIRTFIKKFGKGKALTNTSHLSLSGSPPSNLQHRMCVSVCVCVCDCVWLCVSQHLRQHAILPPPGHADGEQVVDRGGILQAGLARVGLVWQTTDHCLAAGLDEQRCWVRKGKRKEEEEDN